MLLFIFDFFGFNCHWHC